MKGKNKISKQALKNLKQAMKEREKREQRDALKGGVKFNNRITEIKNEILASTKRDKMEVYRKGELLVEAKILVGHGNFKPFVEENFEFSYQTANNMMNVYKCCMGNPDIVKTIETSLLYMIASPDFPEDLRKYIFQNKEDLKKVENKKLRDIYKRFKKRKLDLGDDEIKNLFKQKYTEEIDAKIDEIDNFKASVISRVNKFTWPVTDTRTISIKDSQMKRVKMLVKEIVSTVEKLKPHQDGQKK